MAVVEILTALNWLGLLPWLGPGPSVRTFNLWYAFLYALLAWVYIWLAQMLWKVDASAWIFLAVITIFNLMVGFVAIIAAGIPTTDLTTLSLIFNGLVLIYIMLPSTRDAFGKVWVHGN
ncbi:hypothetical protein V7O62_12530 [Methanolobus sp. ZRKC2]|uniref:hypothetical protein n=1 Tax=Methanolobus sp. ZRKC2 TaxID=3125783 RepID=UPI00324AAD9D